MEVMDVFKFQAARQPDTGGGMGGRPVGRTAGTGLFKVWHWERGIIWINDDHCSPMFSTKKTQRTKVDKSDIFRTGFQGRTGKAETSFLRNRSNAQRDSSQVAQARSGQGSTLGCATFNGMEWEPKHGWPEKAPIRKVLLPLFFSGKIINIYRVVGLWLYSCRWRWRERERDTEW